MRPRTDRVRQQAHASSGRVGVIAALVLLGVIAFFAWKGSERPVQEGGLSAAEQYEADGRIAPLLVGCPFGAPFEADTSNLPEVLASKLDTGLLEPKRRATAVLASLGDEAAEPLRRLFQSATRDQWREGVARNVLAVCALAEDDWGVPIALEALRSPKESQRGDAVLVLLKHPSPELFDPLAASLAGFRLEVHLTRVLSAMAACDVNRLAAAMPEWVARAERVGDYIESTVIDAAAPLVGTVDDPEVAAMLLRLAEENDALLLRHQAYLLAPAARAGLGDARQRLMDLLAHEQRMPRHHASEALLRAGLVDDTYVLAATAEDAGERSQTLERILDFDAETGAERSPEQRADVLQWAQLALRDEEAKVRETALKGLLARRDEQGRAFLMALLKGTVVERGLGMRAMRGQLDGWTAASDQARNLVASVYEAELAGARRGDVLTSTLQAMGAIPGRESGLFLLQAGDLVGENPIRGVSGFRWCVGQAFNAGRASQEVLRDRLLVEQDPMKRLDLISFIWQDFEVESVQALVDVLDDASRSPYERLYAADRAVRMGHAEVLLPVMKRVYRSESDRVLRRGLHCLLWVWFGPSLA